MHRAAFDERAHVRLGTWFALGAAGILMLLSLPWFPTVIQAWGNNLAAAAPRSVPRLAHPASAGCG